MMRRELEATRRRRRGAIAAELTRLREIERVALDFCMRCERGEIRSVATYDRFRAAIAGPGSEPARALGFGAVASCGRSWRS